MPCLNCIKHEIPTWNSRQLVKSWNCILFCNTFWISNTDRHKRISSPPNATLALGQLCPNPDDVVSYCAILFGLQTETHLIRHFVFAQSVLGEDSFTKFYASDPGQIQLALHGLCAETHGLSLACRITQMSTWKKYCVASSPQGPTLWWIKTQSDTAAIWEGRGGISETKPFVSAAWRARADAGSQCNSSM